MPVPPVGQVTALVRWPGHNVFDPGPDLLITAGASVGLGRRTGRDSLNQPSTVAAGLLTRQTAASQLFIELGGLVAAPVTTRHTPPPRSSTGIGVVAKTPPGLAPEQAGRNQMHQEWSRREARLPGLLVQRLQAGRHHVQPDLVE